MAINVELDDLRDQADEFMTQSEEQQGIIDECDGFVDALDDMWEGSAKDSFVSQWAELKPSLEAAVELLENVSQQLDGVADTMEETDEALASSMGN